MMREDSPDTLNGGGTMTWDELLDVLQTAEYFHLATVENGEPRVRMMRVYRVDDDGIVFNTAADKDVHRQLEADPRVECCFNDIERLLQVRVRGTAGFIDDIEIKMGIVDNSPHLQSWIEREGFDALAVCRVHGCVATVWRGDNEEMETLPFPGGPCSSGG